MSEPVPIQVGDKLGQFKLVELIAVGGMGIVYRSYDTALDRYVAVKVLAPELSRDKVVARRFLDEARAAAALNHSNVVHIYSAGEQAGTFYFVMELVNGQHLEALFNSRAPLPVREATDLIRQAAIGLQHAHEHGLIHGDVKPANFLVAETGVLKITDFGLARRIKAASSSSDGESLFGTPGYVSPEVVQGSPPDHRSDIYSLGATFFHALAGRAPFAGATPEETLRRHTRDEAPSIQKFNGDVPPAIAQIVARMLAKEPSGRYQSYSDLLQALNRQSGEAPAKPSPGGLRAGPRLSKGPRPGAPDPAAAPAPAEPPVAPKRDTWIGFAFTVIAFLASILILILVYKLKLADRLSGSEPPAQTNVVTVAPRPAEPAHNLEVEARTEFDALKAEADAALAAGRWGRATAIFNKWPAVTYSNTTIHLAVSGELQRIQEAAQQAWLARQQEIAPLRADGKWAEALEIVDNFARECSGLPALLKEIGPVRQALADAARAVAEERAAAELARRTRLDQLQAQVDGFITGYQWERGQQELQRAASGDAEWSQALADWQAELASLIALRDGVAARLKTKPSALLTLTTKRGEMQAQATSLDASGVTLRQTFGEAGFAETTVAWSELTPASACRVLMLNLDANNADELFGYAVLIARQALARQARPEDARKTLQVALQRDPARALIIERYLAKLTELESAPPPAAVRQPEAEAANLWRQLQDALVRNHWERVTALVTTLVTDYANTGFVKSRMHELQQIATRAGQQTAPKGYLALDISDACNATLFEHRGAGDNGFRGKQRFSDLPEAGRVSFPDAEPGEFQLRVNEKKDAIALTWGSGRFPMAVTVNLPAAQQRRYGRLALLSAASVGSATLKVELNYDTGAPTEAKFKAHPWEGARVPAGTRVALELPAARRMFIDLLEVDPRRRLTGLKITWITANTEHPQHCVGIFAISALPAETAR